MAKQANGQLETTRQQLRRLRQKALQQVKGGSANGVSEDEIFTLQKDVQDLTDEFTKRATENSEKTASDVLSP